MRQRLEIKVSDEIPYNSEYFEHSPIIDKKDYPNIFLDHEVTIQEFNKALDVIVTYMMQNKHYKILLDLYERNKSLEPPTEMTIEEIEEELGHKIKIVGKEE